MALHVEFVPPEGPSESARFVGRAAELALVEDGLHVLRAGSEIAHVSGQQFVHTPGEMSAGISAWNNAPTTFMGEGAYTRTVPVHVAGMAYRGLVRAHQSLVENKYASSSTGGNHDRERQLSLAVARLFPIRKLLEERGEL